MPDYRHLARNRDFTILWAGETVNELGSTLSAFVFPLLAWALTHSTIAAALLEAAYLLGLTVSLLLGGVLADRVDLRRLMLGASGSGALLYGSLALAGFLGGLTMGHLLAVALLTGLARGVYEPAQGAAVRAVVATEDLPTAMSQNQARQHLASLLGGPLGGALYAVRTWAPFAVDTVTYALSCLTLTRIRTDLRPPARMRRTGIWADLVEGFRYIRGNSFMRALLVWAAQSNLLVNACFFAITIRLVRDGFPAAAIGLVSTAAGTGGIVGAMVAPYVIDRCPTGVLTIVVAWGCALPLLPLVWWSTPTAAAVSAFALVVTNPIGNAGIGAYRVSQTPAGMQGRVGGALNFAGIVAMPLAPVVGGLLLTRLGGSGAVLALVGLTCVAALVPTLSRSIRSVPRPARWPRLETAGVTGRRAEAGAA